MSNEAGEFEWKEVGGPMSPSKFYGVTNPLHGNDGGWAGMAIGA